MELTLGGKLMNTQIALFSAQSSAYNAGLSDCRDSAINLVLRKVLWTTVGPQGGVERAGQNPAPSVPETEMTSKLGVRVFLLNDAPSVSPPYSTSMFSAHCAPREHFPYKETMAALELGTRLILGSQAGSSGSLGFGVASGVLTEACWPA